MNSRLLLLGAVFALSPLVIAASPEPVKLSPPASPNVVTDPARAQIEKITMMPSTALPGIYLEEPTGHAWTLAFWINLNDDPRYASSEFTRETPVILADFMTNNPQFDQHRVIIRIMGGKFNVTEQNKGQWRMLRGFASEVTPGTWYFLTYTRTATFGTFYINGDIALKTAANLPTQDGLSTLVFGNFMNQRIADGVVLQPRLYAKELTREEVLKLMNDRPASAR